jgi:predicted Rossmann fold flavoprotein
MDAKIKEPSGGPFDLIVVGGGAAGFFCALSAAEVNPNLRILVLDGGKKVLRKVRISGGGRCNLTHHCFDPKELSERYPRGGRQLRGAFHHFQPKDTIEWFSKRGVATKTEADGRMFPVSDCSQSVINCLEKSAREARVEVWTESKVREIDPPEAGNPWSIKLGDGRVEKTEKLCLAMGSLAHSGLVQIIENLDHKVVPLVPSLFAFNLRNHPMKDLSGISVPLARVRILPKSPFREGPLLITHRGLSGPAILKLSAWEARDLHERGHRFLVEVNWLGTEGRESVGSMIRNLREKRATSKLGSNPLGQLPKRLWARILERAGISDDRTWAHLPKSEEEKLIANLVACELEVDGKTTNKDEFVTCGGVSLKEVDFRTMESKIHSGLYYAGECLDLDGVTGGFNFQAAWTTGRIAGSAIASAV